MTSEIEVQGRDQTEVENTDVITNPDRSQDDTDPVSDNSNGNGDSGDTRTGVADGAVTSVETTNPAPQPTTPAQRLAALRAKKEKEMPTVATKKPSKPATKSPAKPAPKPAAKPQAKPQGNPVAKAKPAPKPAPKPTSDDAQKSRKKDGLRAPQIRTLKLLAASKEPLGRAEICKNAPVVVGIITYVVGSDKDDIRLKNDKEQMVSLLTLGYVTAIRKDGQGTAYKITPEGRTALKAAQTQSKDD